MLWKTLGIYWDRSRDHLSFISLRTSSRDSRDSKRQMLSTASSMHLRLNGLPGHFHGKTQNPISIFVSTWNFLGRSLPDDVDHLWVKWKQELEELPLIN
ncbi:hypothetical protein T12_11383, partial [Trichinella patagoniensis]